MSFIHSVTLPKTVKVGEEFEATLDCEVGDSKEIEVQPKGPFDVSPSTIPVKPGDVKVTAKLKVTGMTPPAAGEVIMIRFKLGTSTASAGTEAKP